VGRTSVTLGTTAVDYLRDAAGRLSEIRQAAANQLLVGFDHSGDGAPSTVRYGTALNEARTFDARGRLTAQTAGAFALRYGYGSDGFTRQTTQGQGTAAREGCAGHSKESQESRLPYDERLPEYERDAGRRFYRSDVRADPFAGGGSRRGPAASQFVGYT